MRAVPARVGRRNESRPGRTAGEVDRCDDATGEVRVGRDTAVEYRDADAFTGDAELTPNVGRSDLEDARA